MCRYLAGALCVIFFVLPLLAGDDQIVILVSFDGFRWDYAHRGLTPNLDKVRAEGVSASSLEPAWPTKTFPNHISIVTGMYPENHGIILNRFQDLFTDEWYRIGNSDAVRESKWYQGEAIWETARRQGVKCASYFWPGSELPEPHRSPHVREAYEHERPYEERVDGVLSWLQLPATQRPRFITLYFHETDTQGHIYGPDSAELNTAVQVVDTLLGRLRDGIDELGLSNLVNIILVSDHGMTAVSPDRMVNVEKFLGERRCVFTEYGPFMLVRPMDGNDQEVYDLLKSNELHYKTYWKHEVPSRFHFSKHPFITPIVLITDLGWSVVNNFREKRILENPGGGNHGYDNAELDMHGLFHAVGPAFKQNFRTGTVRNIDIYPLICTILNIQPRLNIDGDLDRIVSVLRDH